MLSQVEDEWSDSEDDASEMETSILLGVPDGEIEEPSDLSDPAVSRIGGLPVFLPSRALSPSGALCKSCSCQMPLLVQMWCPFEGSPLDRVLYVWGCGRPDCQRKAGSVRAWRGLKFNRKYANKLAKRETREAERSLRKAAEAVAKEEEQKRQRMNPFSGSGSLQMTSGLGTHLFGDTTRPLQEDSGHEDDRIQEPDSDHSSDQDELDDIADLLESTSLQHCATPADWASSPSYKPVYLSTTSEYIPSSFKTKKQFPDFPDESVDPKGNKDWGLEGWESSAGIDPVFERFVRRVSYDNEQCVRYDLKGVPMPFGSRDTVYDRLFPPPRPAAFTTKPGFATPISQRRTFNSDTLDKCDACGGQKVFECQLMPNLINVLRGQTKRSTGDGKGANGMKDESKSPGKENKTSEAAEMEWGTCFIFTCEKNCCANEDEGWMEELVLIQWDQ